jgi:hypothetical protein
LGWMSTENPCCWCVERSLWEIHRPRCNDGRPRNACLLAAQGIVCETGCPRDG